MLINEIHSTELDSPVQTVKARVELYNGSILDRICNCGDVLNSFSIERTGEGKFFGFGICQKLQTNLMDEDREINLTPNHTIEVSFGVGNDYLYPYPNFYINEITRDEDNNDLTVVAYDILYKAAEHTVSELTLPSSYTIKTFALACAALLGVPLTIVNVDDDCFDTSFEVGANFSGSENIRSALNAIAEATQTIYYMNSNWELTFKRLDRSGDSVLTIEKTEYMDFRNQGLITLSGVSHVTELGDNISAPTTIAGVTQFIRDNPFWELREDVAALLTKAQEIVGGTTISQFECNWFGNYLLEIGDKIDLITRDDEIVTSYILEDVLSFEGSIEQNTRWSYDENSAENESNPTTLGEVLNQTFARVDKANQEIELVASKTDSNSSELSALKINTDSISTSVTKITNETTEQLNSINDEISGVKTEVSNFKQESDNALLEFKTTIEENGVTKVDTGSFRFDETGLTVSNTDSEISTQITEDGMTVSINGAEMLVANNQGVSAEDLHATTYLIIGNNSRIEDWSGRTACFWIGG